MPESKHTIRDKARSLPRKFDNISEDINKFKQSCGNLGYLMEHPDMASAITSRYKSPYKEEFLDDCEWKVVDKMPRVLELVHQVKGLADTKYELLEKARNRHDGFFKTGNVKKGIEKLSPSEQMKEMSKTMANILCVINAFLSSDYYEFTKYPEILKKQLKQFTQIVSTGKIDIPEQSKYEILEPMIQQYDKLVENCKARLKDAGRYGPAADKLRALELEHSTISMLIKM